MEQIDENRIMNLKHDMKKDINLCVATARIVATTAGTAAITCDVDTSISETLDTQMEMDDRKIEYSSVKHLCDGIIQVLP